jgi:hypothetical protein
MIEPIKILINFIKKQFNIKLYIIYMSIFIIIYTLLYNASIIKEIPVIAILIGGLIGIICGDCFIFSSIVNKKIKVIKELQKFLDNIYTDTENIRKYISKYKHATKDVISDHSYKFIVMILEYFIYKIRDKKFDLSGELILKSYISYITYILANPDFIYMNEVEYNNHKVNLSLILLGREPVE